MIKRARSLSARYHSLKWIVACAAIAAIAIIGTAAAWQGDSGRGVLTIAGIEVPEEEFRLFLQDEKANVADYFYQTYGAEYGEAFWDTSYGGEIPIETARQRALARLERIKAEQLLAVEYGVWPSAEYEQIRKELSRQSSAYGAESLDLLEKYMTYHSKTMLDTKEKYKAATGPVPEEELRRYYEANADESFKMPDKMITLSFRVVRSDDPEVQDKVVGKINAIVQEIRDGEDAEKLQERPANPYILDIRVNRYGSEEGKDEHSSALESAIKEAAYTLQSGETSEPIDYGSDRYVLVCLERTEGAVAAFEEVSLVIEDLLLEEQFDLLAAEKARLAAAVILDAQRYDRLRL